MNNGPTMEYKRILYRSSSNVSEFMLKGDRMKRNCYCQRCSYCKRFNQIFNKPSTTVRVKADCSIYPDSQCRYRPAKIQYKPKGIKATLNTERYLKLHNGDIYDCDTNSILNRLSLQDFMG